MKTNCKTTMTMVGLMLVGAMSLSGCRAILKSSPAAHAGFIKKPDEMREGKHISQLWFSEQLVKDQDNYTKIIIPPVNTAYLMKTGTWRQIKTKSDQQVREDIKFIASYMDGRFRDAFAGGKVKRFMLTEEPGPDTLKLEVAFVELVPTDVVSNAAGKVAGFFVPGGGLISTGTGGSIAFEARLSDSETGVVLAKGKDRRVDKIAPADLAGLTPYRHARRNINDWVDGFVRWFNADSLDEEVHVAPKFSLSPW